MGYSSQFFFEAKMYVLSAKEGCPVFSQIEYGCLLFLAFGKASVVWLLETVEALIQKRAEGVCEVLEGWQY
jgi:hypothetical protein